MCGFLVAGVSVCLKGLREKEGPDRKHIRRDRERLLNL